MKDGPIPTVGSFESTCAALFSEQEIDYFDNLEVPDVDIIATEGIMSALVHTAPAMAHSMLTDVGGWLRDMESRRRYINSVCEKIIEWLEHKDKQYDNLKLEMGFFKTWFKTSPTFFWRYFLLLNNYAWADIKKDIKDKNPDVLLNNLTANMPDRKAAAQHFEKAANIKDLIKEVRCYIKRNDEVHELIMRHRPLRSKTISQIVLSGAIDMRITVKKIVKLAE